MKILYVTTLIGTMSFFIAEIKHLQECGHTVDIASNEEGNTRFDAIALGVKVYHLPFSRSPLSADNLKAYKQLKKIVSENHYDIVHCHTPNAAALTRLSCKGIRKKGTKIIYTAHGFHFYKGAPKMNWLVYYPLEWLFAHWTDTLITINSEDYKLAKEKMKAGKVEYVPGVGIDLSKFSNIAIDVTEKRKELGIPEGSRLLLSVGELNENKNHETVLRAIADMENVYYIIAGKGDLQEHLHIVINEHGLSKRVKLLGYRNDIIELYKISDVYVMPSFREGLSVALMEAMASGLPCAVSKIRGNTDLIDENGGVLFDPYSIDECKSAILRFLNGDHAAMGKYNKEKIKQFSIEVVQKNLNDIYGEFK